MALGLSKSIDVAYHAMRDLRALNDQFLPHERDITCLLYDERLSKSITAS